MTRSTSVLALWLWCVACSSDPAEVRVAAGSEVIDEQPLSKDTQTALLKGPKLGETIAIAPIGEGSVPFVVDEIEPAGQGATYLGHVAQQDGSQVTITVLGGQIAGTVRTAGQIHQLASGPKGPVVRQVDPDKAPPDHPDKYGSGDGDDGEPPGPIGEAGDTCSTDDPRRVTLLMLYTADARAAAGGTAAVEATIYAAISETNRAYVNSNIDLRLDIVHFEEVPYTSVDHLTDVCRLHDAGDGFLDDVQAKRDFYGADLVAMINTSTDACGVTYGELLDPSGSCTDPLNHDVVRTPSNAHEEGGYHTFALSCLATNFTLPHEFGHSFSARHNWACDGSNNRPTHTNHGSFFNDGTTAGSWRTIMSYPASTGCGTPGPRVAQFSNPLINFRGNPTGSTAEPRPTDNHAVHELVRPVVANYRCSTPSPRSVWMKDTWGDTGAEPDPDPEAMYLSPYVWTRNSRDPVVAGTTDRYQHEHEHQNPVLHAPTWSYVKLHNDTSSDAVGRVRLYYANASTSLAWQSAWTLVGEVDVAAGQFTAGTTKVIEIPWADPPGLGHYCLTARWESATDPMPAEGTDIGDNTRRSNNIIWRNLEILRMPGPGGDVAESQFLARPYKSKAMTLVFASPGRTPFLPAGDLDVKLVGVDTSFQASAGPGVEQTGPNAFHVTANGGRLTIALPRAKGDIRVDVKLRRPSTMAVRDYRVTVEQLENLGAGEISVGGVGYDIRP